MLVIHHHLEVENRLLKELQENEQLEKHNKEQLNDNEKQNELHVNELQKHERLVIDKLEKQKNDTKHSDVRKKQRELHLFDNVQHRRQQDLHRLLLETI